MALLYDAADSQYTQRDQAPFDGSGAFSLSVRFSTTATAGGAIAFVGRLEAGNIYVTIRTDDTGKVIGQFRGAANVNLTSTGTFNDGKWHAVVLTWNGTNKLTLYIASEVEDRTLANSFPGVLNRVATGGLRDSSPSDFYTGLADNFKVWTRELTAQEAADTIAGSPPVANHDWSLNDFSPHKDSVGTLDMTGFGTASVPQLYVTAPPSWQRQATTAAVWNTAGGAIGMDYHTVHTTSRTITNSDSPYSVLSGQTLSFDPTNNIQFKAPRWNDANGPTAGMWFVLKNERSYSVAGTVTIDPGTNIPIEPPETVDSPVLVTGPIQFNAHPLASYRWAYHDGVGWLLDYKYRPAETVTAARGLLEALPGDNVYSPGILNWHVTLGAGFITYSQGEFTPNATGRYAVRANVELTSVLPAAKRPNAGETAWSRARLWINGPNQANLATEIVADCIEFGGAGTTLAATRGQAHSGVAWTLDITTPGSLGKFSIEYAQEPSAPAGVARGHMDVLFLGGE